MIKNHFSNLFNEPLTIMCMCCTGVSKTGRIWKWLWENTRDKSRQVAALTDSLPADCQCWRWVASAGLMSSPTCNGCHPHFYMYYPSSSIWNHQHTITLMVKYDNSAYMDGHCVIATTSECWSIPDYWFDWLHRIMSWEDKTVCVLFLTHISNPEQVLHFPAKSSIMFRIDNVSALQLQMYLCLNYKVLQWKWFWLSIISSSQTF